MWKKSVGKHAEHKTNAEGFALWRAETKQICRQSSFAESLAVETSSFKETFCKIDEPRCPVFHNYMGKAEVIQKASKPEKVSDIYRRRGSVAEDSCMAVCKPVVLGVNSSAMFFYTKIIFSFKDEDTEWSYAGLAKFQWRFTEADLKLGAWPAPGVHGRVTTLSNVRLQALARLAVWHQQNERYPPPLPLVFISFCPPSTALPCRALQLWPFILLVFMLRLARMIAIPQCKATLIGNKSTSLAVYLKIHTWFEQLS